MLPQPMPFIFTGDDPGRGDVALFHDLLDFLAEEDVPATFFTIPCAARSSLAERPAWVEALQRAKEEGHDLQLHGFVHGGFEFGQPPDFVLDLMSFSSDGQRGWAALDHDRAHVEAQWQQAVLRDRLRNGQQIFREVLDIEPLAFRSPCLSTCPALYGALDDVGIKCDSSLAINHIGWEYCRKEFGRRSVWDDRIAPHAYPITARVIEVPVMSEYTWFIAPSEVDVHLQLAREDFDRAAALDRAAFVPLSHFYAMTGEHRAGLDLYRRLFAHARARGNVHFMTITDYYRHHTVVSS